MTESKGSADRTFSYDGVGNLRSAVDGNGRLTQWSYDNLYRMTSETWRQTASPTSTVLRTFNYDFDAVGRVTEVAASHSLAPDSGFVYDARGQRELWRAPGLSLVLFDDWSQRSPECAAIKIL